MIGKVGKRGRGGTLFKEKPRSKEKLGSGAHAETGGTWVRIVRGKGRTQLGEKGKESGGKVQEFWEGRHSGKKSVQGGGSGAHDNFRFLNAGEATKALF